MRVEHFFECPYCGEEISFIPELTDGDQKYIEDCEVCCNPIQISFKTDGEQLLLFEAERAD